MKLFLKIFILDIMNIEKVCVDMELVSFLLYIINI